jgi:hypothetical protein
MQTTRYTDILERLTEVMAFCSSLGLNLDGTRFEVYGQRIERLIEEISRASIKETPPHLAGGLSDLEYFFPLTEAAEFGDVLPYLQTLDPSVLRKKIEVILRGPVLPSDEDLASNQARNILFELTLAARLWDAGFQPRLGEHPDLVCAVEGRELLFECKRPLSPGKVKKRINEAGDQLRANLKVAAPGARGIIAVSVSKVLNPGDKLYVGPNEYSMRRGLEREIFTTAEKAEKVWQKFHGSRIIGIIFHVITPGHDQQSTRYVIAQNILGISLAASNTQDAMVIRALASALKRMNF